jgi:methanogenic corrinoid protein MtbC1
MVAGRLFRSMCEIRVGTSENLVCTLIEEKADEITNSIVNCQLEKREDLERRYGEQGSSFYKRDIKYHLQFLCAALRMSSIILFESYIEWLKVLMSSLNVPLPDVRVNLDCIKEVLQNLIPKEIESNFIEYLDSGINQFESAPGELPTFLGKDAPLSLLATQYLNSLLKGKRKIASNLIMNAIENGVDLKEIYLHVFMQTQREVGRLWLSNKLSVAQEHYCTAATYLIMSQLHPYIRSSTRKGKSVVLTCVSGELHDMGLRVIADFFDIDGWDVFYLGANAPTTSILNFVENRNPDLLAISTTMTFHLPEAQKIIQMLKSSNLTSGIKVLVGGRPFNIDQELWKKIGADGFAENAERAIEVANKLVQSE